MNTATGTKASYEDVCDQWSVLIDTWRGAHSIRSELFKLAHTDHRGQHKHFVNPVDERIYWREFVPEIEALEDIVFDAMWTRTGWTDEELRAETTRRLSLHPAFAA